MAIIVNCDQPRVLLRQIREGIEDGLVRGWSYDEDGDFSYTVARWEGRAWLRPRIRGDRLTLNIVTPRGQQMTTMTYAVYHARFAQMLLTHFDSEFDDVRISASPNVHDEV
jgi:hypothetical protein